MAWPSSRLTTYTPGDPVKSNDLNTLQDGIIAGGQHGPIWVHVPPFGFYPTGFTPNPLATALLSGGPGSTMYGICLPLRRGCRVCGIAINADRGGAGTIVLNGYLSTNNGSSFSVGTITINSGTGWAEVQAILGTPNQANQGEHLTFSITSDNVAHTIGTISALIDHP